MSGEMKFDKEETSVAVDLKGLDENISAAIDKTAQDSIATGSRFSAPSSDVDVAVDTMAMKSVSPLMGAALTAQEEVRGSKSSSPFMGEGSGGSKASRKGSIFIGQAPSQQQRMSNAMGLPMSYNEKKTAVKQANRAAFDESRGKGKSGGGRDLMGDVNAVGAALTGHSAGHAKPHMCKGIKMDPHAAARLGLVPQALVDTLDSVRAAQNSPAMSAARLQEGLGRGEDGAEQFVKNNPVLAEQIFKNADVKPQVLEPKGAGGH